MVGIDDGNGNNCTSSLCRTCVNESPDDRRDIASVSSKTTSHYIPDDDDDDDDTCGGCGGGGDGTLELGIVALGCMTPMP